MPDDKPLGAGLDWADPRSRLAPLYLTPGGVAAVAVFCAAALVFAAGPLWHTDFWSHLRYGEVIAAAGRLPDRDPLTPFAAGPPAAGAWLSQLSYHGLIRLGGPLAGGVELVRLAHLLAGLATLGLLALALRRAGATAGWAAAGAALLAALIPGSLAVQRPQLLVLPLFAAVLVALSRPTPTRRAVAWVPLVLLLWANLHGSFAVGLGIVTLRLLGKLAERDEPAARRLAQMLLLAVAAACVNPVGPAVFAESVRYAGHPNLRTLAEWQPLHFTLGPGGHRAYLLALALVLTGARRFSRADWLVLVPFAVWPLFQQRAFVWLALLAVWLAIPRLSARFPGRPVVPDFRRTAFAGLLVGLTLVASPAARWLAVGPRPLAAALPPVEFAASLGPGGPVFASETLGDYLAWAAPHRPVLMTNHAPAFAPDHWRKCLAVKAAEPGWEAALREFGATVVVVEAAAHPDLAAALGAAPGWRVRPDPTGRLLVATRE